MGWVGDKGMYDFSYNVMQASYKPEDYSSISKFNNLINVGSGTIGTKAGNNLRAFNKLQLHLDSGQSPRGLAVSNYADKGDNRIYMSHRDDGGNSMPAQLRTVEEIIKKVETTNDDGWHPKVLRAIREDKRLQQYVVGTEMPFFYRRSDGKLISGDIDVIFLINGELIIYDYKPEYKKTQTSPKGGNTGVLEENSASVSNTFLDTIPQLVAYSSAFKQRSGFRITDKIKAIWCATGNSETTWVYSDSLLSIITNAMRRTDTLEGGLDIGGQAIWDDFL